MSSPAMLLELIGQAILPALADLSRPPDTTQLAQQLWAGWAVGRDLVGRRADLEALLDTDLAPVVAEVVHGLLPGRATPAHAALERYLLAVPACFARHPALEPRSSADLLRWLPPRIPRFLAGERPFGVGDRELIRLLRMGMSSIVWLAVNPLLPAKTVPLAFMADRDRAMHTVDWHRRWYDQGGPAGVVALEHTYLDKDLPPLQFAATNVGPQPRDSGPQHTALFRKIVEIVARLHRLKQPLALGCIDLADVILEADGPRLLVVDPCSATPAGDVQQLGRLGLHLLGSTNEALASLCTTPDAPDAGAFLARLDALSPSQQAKPAEPARARSRAASRVRDVLGSIAGPQRELAKLVANSVGMKLSLIPAGTFRMGAPTGEVGRRDNEGPVHDVILTKPFYLGIVPVTQTQYRAVMGTNPARFQGAAGGGPEHPVESVSWDDCVAFCRALNDLPAEKEVGRVYRLPTEAEWEYACRAGTSTAFYFGDVLDSSQACFDGRYPYGEGRRGTPAPRTAKVESFAANLFGLYDMHGNVWEWCHDWYDPDYYETAPRQDPIGPPAGELHVVRGGSWRNQASTLRAAYRNAMPGNQRQPYIGFRVALTASDG